MQDLSIDPGYYKVAGPPRSAINKDDWAVISNDSIKANGDPGYNLRWTGPDSLEVSYWEGNVDIDKNYKAGRWPWSKHITITTKREYPKGVSYFADPPRRS